MRRIVSILSLILFLSFLSVFARGQNIVLKQSNESGIYKKGQKLIFTALTRGVNDSLQIRVLKNNDQVILKRTIRPDTDSLTVYDGSFNEPVSIMVEIRLKGVTSTLGAIVVPEKLKPGLSRPTDFKAYWKAQKNSLKELPFEIKTTPVLDFKGGQGFSCVDIEINCLGPKPARGYFAKPEKSAPKSLPIVLLVHAAGVKGSWCRSEPGNALNYAKKGALCFDLNAHGMLNGQPENYYSDLEAGELKNYFLKGITNREEVYFRAMFLRLLRTIEFLTLQPEWDGKRILVMGESQGGGQALAAAGLDNRVTAVVAIVPAMCDWFGPLANRKGGWPQPYESGASKPAMQSALPYFDNANILNGSKAIIFTEIGLIDMTCPPTSVFTAINQSKGKVIIYAVPYRPHQQPQGELLKKWQSTVYKPREAFITDFLK